MESIDFNKFNLDTIGTPEIMKEFDERYGSKETSRGMERDKGASDEMKKNQELLQKAMADWKSLADFRKRRKRSRRYARGDQWSELVKDPDSKEGKMITEENLIKKRGRVPLKQNVIRPVIKNIIGQFRLNKTKPMVMSRRREDAKAAEMLTMALLAAEKMNATRELDARNLEEFLISGMAIQKQGMKMWKEIEMDDLFQENVNPNRIFFNSDVSDIRGTDIIRVGEIIDAPVDDIIAAFASSPKEEEVIKKSYKNLNTDQLRETYGLSSKAFDEIDFLVPMNNDRARVYEIWELRSEWRIYCHDYLHGEYYFMSSDEQASIEQENARRIAMATEQGVPTNRIPLIEATNRLAQYWYVKYLTPSGECLYEAESPYEHGEHPYSMLLYPLIDGEVYGLVEDILDQQRHINRIIGMLDWIIGNSAKGVLMAPWDSVPDEESPADWAEKWTKADEVMFYKPKPGVPPPQQVSANSVNIGAKELLSIQMTLMKEISGVHGAIQGQEAKSGTPASLYAQEAQNAAINSMDIMEIFSWFREKRDMKALKIIVQYYDDRHLIISGKEYDEEQAYYNATKARNLQYDLVITQSADAPVFRAHMDDMLYRLLEMGGIDLEIFLENTSLPFADRILEAIKARKEAAEQGQIPAGMDAGLQQEIAAEADNHLQQVHPQLQQVLRR